MPEAKAANRKRKAARGEKSMNMRNVEDENIFEKNTISTHFTHARRHPYTRSYSLFSCAVLLVVIAKLYMLTSLGRTPSTQCQPPRSTKREPPHREVVRSGELQPHG